MTYLKELPADRHFVEQLYQRGLIDNDGRNYALNTLYPNHWGLWVARFLALVGTALLLAGIICFFAFNWQSIPPFIKLGAIELAIIACVLTSSFGEIRLLGRQLLMLSASVLVGVFLAVYGQIYQMGADSYLLFITWAVLISGWTIISQFKLQWLFWLIISNIVLVLFWQQVMHVTHLRDMALPCYMALFNSLVLLVREHFAVQRGCEWLQDNWTRIIPVLIIVASLFMSSALWIIESGRTLASSSLQLYGMIGLLGHMGLFLVYRHKMLDIRALTIVLISAILLTELSLLKALRHASNEITLPFVLLVTTLVLFTALIKYLRQLVANNEVSHV